jgi:hypothetical protein
MKIWHSQTDGQNRMDGMEVRKLSRSKIEERRRRLRLDLLEVPWDPDGRGIVRAEMDELGMTQDALFAGLWSVGWRQSYSTLGRWLRGQSEPSATELGLLTGILAEYSADWPKASNLSSPQSDYSFWSLRDLARGYRLHSAA